MELQFVEEGKAMAKKISISMWIGGTFVLLLLVLPHAFGSLPGDILTRWNGAQIQMPFTTSLLISILIAGLFFVLTSCRTLRD